MGNSQADLQQPDASLSRLGWPKLTLAIALGLAFLILAASPLLWVVRSWSAPGYDSPGALIFCLVGALFVWSLSSPVAEKSVAASSMRATRTAPVVLLILSFAIRLASQLLAINVLGALMLALDVFACALMLRLQDRSRAVNPAALGLLFCFALPLEPLLQRTLGFGLQQLSALGACELLSIIQPGVQCSGVRITIDGLDVLVDLPCSGARLLISLLTAFLFLAAISSLTVFSFAAGLAITLLVALITNALRITVLALGLHYRHVLGFDVMLDPWHSGIGLITSGLSIALVLCWFRLSGKRLSNSGQSVPSKDARRAAPICDLNPAVRKPRRARRAQLVKAMMLAGLVISLSIGVVSLQADPIDVSAPVEEPKLPLSLNGEPQVALPLSAQEQTYFKTYGGTAVRAGYGENSLLVVSTTSPLRHLHAPDVCFSASGHDIQYVSADFSASPASIYRSRSPSGEDLRVRVSFVSASGAVTHSIAEVVWRWFRDPSEAWTMIQTVTPWRSQTSGFDAAVRRALNLSNSA